MRTNVLELSKEKEYNSIRGDGMKPVDYISKRVKDIPPNINIQKVIEKFIKKRGAV